MDFPKPESVRGEFDTACACAVCGRPIRLGQAFLTFSGDRGARARCCSRGCYWIARRFDRQGLAVKKAAKGYRWRFSTTGLPRRRLTRSPSGDTWR